MDAAPTKGYRPTVAIWVMIPVVKVIRISMIQGPNMSRVIKTATILGINRITSYNVCYTKLLRKLDQVDVEHFFIILIP